MNSKEIHKNFSEMQPNCKTNMQTEFRRISIEMEKFIRISEEILKKILP
jgi:hypothetical protein